MNEVVIKAEGVGKLYKLGETGTGTISHDLNRWWAKYRGKADPFARIGEVNDRTIKGNSNWVWALKDISFELRKGEVLGIIGRNGAGKSTLLKILSKITTPTEGRIKIKGKIASLLEVGTGFHQELTGRENIFLNGSILGMTKEEIKRKFDEIIDFAGVDRYIDTPVKRYSSGMYMRLAFAVAAFLEPDILIIDEVLAVGDAEFQKKCLGRMREVSTTEGRTVLFVSHNMHSISQLCTTGLYLEQGQVGYKGDINGCIDRYLQKAKQSEIDLFPEGNKKELSKPVVTKVRLTADETASKKISVSVGFLSPFVINSPSVGIVIADYLGNPVCGTNNRIHSKNYSGRNCSAGVLRVEIGTLHLLPGTYHLSVFLGDSISDYAAYPDVLTFEVVNSDIESSQLPNSKYIGSMHLTDVCWHLDEYK